MNRIFSLIFLLATIGTTSLCQQSPPSAQDLVTKAQKSAQSSNRNVLVLFHASWCGWCHKMEGVMMQPDIKPLFDKYFVVQWLVTMENGDKKPLENSGAEGFMEKAGGKGTGIPFFYFTDANGRMIVNSLRPAKGADKGGNTGCPYEPEEVAWFMTMLKKAAPRMTESESMKIRKAFESLKKSKGG